MTAPFSFSTWVIDQLHDLELKCAAAADLQTALEFRASILDICYDETSELVTCVNQDEDHWLIDNLNKRLAARPHGVTVCVTTPVVSSRVPIPPKPPKDRAGQDQRFLDAFVRFMQTNPDTAAITTSKVIAAIKRQGVPYGTFPPHPRCLELLRERMDAATPFADYPIHVIKDGHFRYWVYGPTGQPPIDLLRSQLPRDAINAMLSFPANPPHSDA